MTTLPELLSKTIQQATVLSQSSSVETQAQAIFLLSNIKAKKHKKLIWYLESQEALESIKKPFEEYKNKNVKSLSEVLTSESEELSLAQLIAMIFVVQAGINGEKLTLNFKYPLTPETTEEHNLGNDDEEWLLKQIQQLTDSKLHLTVPQWAESRRYLPQSVTPLPGFYSFQVTPYLQEVANCFSVDSAIQEVDFMKGAQLGVTVGVLENTIGYVIDFVKSAPCMLLTADAGLAQLRVESYILPMLKNSELMHLIQSSDERNKRKTGMTKDRIQWAGEGFLVPYGAQNADKLRSISIQYLLEDEVDAFPDKVGKDGDPQKLAEARTKSYYGKRKILRISTPLIKGSSRIDRGFRRGDQRQYFVPCKNCGEYQVLVFQGNPDANNGKVYGLVWEVDEDGILIEDSVRYVCKHCGHKHRNSDKAWMLPRGEWRPTAKPKSKTHRSYQLSALYSPIGMFSWSGLVQDWLEAWDEEHKSHKDIGLLQEFYNNNLGVPFEILGSRIRQEHVSAHRRTEYSMGMVPNKYAQEHAGSRILFLTCQVDVHKRNLAVAVMGWTQKARCFLISYKRFTPCEEGEDCTEISSSVWGDVKTLLEETVFKSDDGYEYSIIFTLVDSAYANDTVVSFCSQYEAGVYPILGRERPAKNRTIKEFAEFKTQQGTTGYHILVDHYKDRLAPVLRREWRPELGSQPQWHFNAPAETSTKALKELTAEVRKEKRESNGLVSYYWDRPGNVRNELWDLLVYGHAAVEILAWSICIKYFELATIDWDRFWTYIEQNELFLQKSLGD